MSIARAEFLFTLHEWKAKALDLRNSIRHAYWWMTGYPEWPSLDAMQAMQLGLTPITVLDEYGNKIACVISVDFQSGEVVQGTGRIVQYQEPKAETVSRFFRKVTFFPDRNLVICSNGIG